MIIDTCLKNSKCLKNYILKFSFPITGLFPGKQPG